ncbi:heterokaryon incompatibility protein Het-C-domain-containing protein [Multifurca ochricompacta]|uniref:Heterokaryon incompatibility protein Het-C-domain-containing protein n=1 Tax=Multifurca ochricompacta TaxID=376703 RepID=A0AAD4QN89_9AGAM|nr:heterokaryon incompatibility protein Het-C-domain-containing protein [Multifurca ochricompacta]
MSFSRSSFLILFTILVVCLRNNGVYAFGAGNIPSFAYMEGRAFRHGDIEDTLSDLAKKAGGFALGALIGKGGSKFGGLDIKRVYFGNWLRDYSQAVDIASLKKVPLQTIINLCMALGFLAHGYATNEFEVTVERLGVYLPVEHIDNPKGYGDGEDARRYDPRLRGPVDPRELEVDPRTGMKNYIGNENGPWDTSRALVRRTLERCIHIGRQYRAQGRKQDEYEAYRLLGQADFTAHSNFCELTLVSLGHSNVFVHVGDNVRIQAPNGRWVAPLVTGTFGSSDFSHSLLGEATDHISEASVSDLNKAIASARSRSVPGGRSPPDILRDLLFKLPGGSGAEMTRDMEGIERIRDAPAQGGKPPEQMSPQELHAVLWQVLSFRDSVVKKIETTIEKIPGLGSLIEKITDSISVFVFTTLEPYLKPILSTASNQLMAASSEVINTHDQYEVFNDPQASDPTHSFLSKDHFNLILNEPAGNIAKVVVKHTVTSVVKAWDDNSVNVRSTTDEILQCLFHPDFQNHTSQIQREMLACMKNWLQSLGHKQGAVLARLSKQAVRDHQNVRLGGEGGAPVSQGGFAPTNAGPQAQGSISNYLQGVPGMTQAQGLYNQFSGGTGGRREGNEFGAPRMPMGSVPVPETAPPVVPVLSRPGGGQANHFFVDSTAPVPSHPFISPPSYPGGPPSAVSPRPQADSPRPQHSPDTHHGHAFGYHSPTQAGFPGASDQPSYMSSSLGFADPRLRTPYPGGLPPGPPATSYPGSSYPGQSSYPGHQGIGFPGMPDGGSDFNSPFNSSSGPPSSFPGTAPSFPQTGPGFPDAQPESGYGSGSYGGYGQSSYRPQY